MKLTDNYLKNICKIGQGKACCRYLTCSADGFECEKLGPAKGILDSRVMYMTAQGDNCEGVDNREKTH